MSNAIIMAAGLGSRFGELTRTIHKTLLPVGGIPNLERIIGCLHESGITEIHIITGHLAESFAYLPERYPGVTLHHNPHYADYNSIFSFSHALPYFGDSYVIDGDTVLIKNPFPAEAPANSRYFTVLREEEGVEWCPVAGAGGFVTHVEVTDRKIPSMSGICYWSARDAEVIRREYSAWMTPEKLKNPRLYYDNVILSVLDRLEATLYELKPRITYEMDNVENYRFVCSMIEKNNSAE